MPFLVKSSCFFHTVSAVERVQTYSLCDFFHLLPPQNFKKHCFWRFKINLSASSIVYDIYIVIIKQNRACFDKSKANRDSEHSAQERKLLADLKLTA